jgi:hypothetical protein
VRTHIARQDFDGLGRDVMATLPPVLSDDDAPPLPPAVPELVVRELVVRESTAHPRT